MGVLVEYGGFLCWDTQGTDAKRLIIRSLDAGEPVNIKLPDGVLGHDGVLGVAYR